MSILKYIFFAVLILFFSSCEKEFVPEGSNDAPQIVVEGFIEAGQNPMNTYVILTKSQSFFSEIGLSTLNNNFIRDAVVTVYNGTKTVQLRQLCLDSLPPALRMQAAAALGFNPDSVKINFCIYVDVLNEMPGAVGGKYDLKIVTKTGETATATTTIPRLVPLDSLYFITPPGDNNDTLAQGKFILKDPAGERNFYRYFTKINQGVYQAGRGSVANDGFINGKELRGTLTKSEPRGVKFNPATFGLFKIGDTASVKWCTLDEAHFNFWNTLEFSANNQGPFSSYTRIKHNIVGGLGIWGGYAVTYTDKLVKK